MDSLLLNSSPDVVERMISVCKSNGFTQTRNYCLISANGHPSFWPLSSQCKPSLRLRTSAVVAAKRDPSKKKSDSHSFIPRPDEATGPFPEAVLLKERKIEEDGRLVPEFADAEEKELFEALSLELESDLDVERMRHYEVVYLIHEDRKDEVESVNIKVQEFIKENKGRIWRFSDWGMRRLAYKIQKAENAHYILMNFELEAKLINDFKSMLDKDERIIRHLVMKRDEAETEDCPPPPEFHTMRSGMDDDDDWGDTEYDDKEDDGDDFLEEDEIDMSSFRDNTEGIIYVDEEVGGRESNAHSTGKRKQKAEKVVRQY
ncbi:protein REGULATOR OF FATTY ACID COMPOSITION 3, chloroplastic [Coffea arabica]|uniref:Protein REGULATOR OF FATTY ACID COMPOSITION 3, chloroplastic n=1 Tax=Coffea arabica TaxID=13443 RepID=A0A6P6WVY4_COFAR|nr:uncharacterized protein LOC113736681 [Coffea arabica]